MVHAWFDVSAGVAGDMLLGSLIDAGADPDAIQHAIDLLIPGAVQLSTEIVDRGGQRATKLGVEVLVADQPHRTWQTIGSMIEASSLHEPTRSRVLTTFRILAEAEAAVHGTDPEQVHFHEVGALDSIADVVGVCEALHLLEIETVSASPVALGAGRIRAAHGDIPVPAPAVARLAIGWQVSAGPTDTELADGKGSSHHHDHQEDHGHTHEQRDELPGHPHQGSGHLHEVAFHGHAHGDGHHHAHGEDHHHSHGEESHPHSPHHGLPHDQPAPVTTPGAVGELATPTGLALIRALATTCEPMPPMVPSGLGVGAGGKDFRGHPNVVRVTIGEPSIPQATPEVIELAANVDDMSPQLWPGVIEDLLAAGALDAWLTPIIMKKGRPAHTIHVLCPPSLEQTLSHLLLERTPTIGVRAVGHRRVVAERAWTTLTVAGQPVDVKIASRGGIVLHASGEFDSLAEAAQAAGLPNLDVAQRVQAAIVAAGLVAGAAVDRLELRIRDAR